MDQFSALKAFCRVVEAGGFSSAAAALNVSHTVMSKQVRQLEALLGAQLLNRTTRRLALTEAGQAYYARARRILDELQEADLAVTQHHAAPRGTLRINAPMAFGTLDVAQWLPRFMARDMPDSSLIAKRLASAATMLVASPAYLAQHGAPSTPQDLERHNCLTYSLVPKPNEWEFTTPEGGRVSVTVSGSLQANTGIALRAAALADVGIATTATFIVHAELERGTLLPVLPCYTMRPRDLFAVYPQNRHLSPKVRAFVDFAADVYRLPRWS